MPNSINSLGVRNVKIRNTNLNINIKGNGSIIKRFCANGKLDDNYIEYVDGAVKVDIEMAKPQKAEHIKNPIQWMGFFIPAH